MESQISYAPIDDLASSNDRLSFTVFLGIALHAILIFGVGASISAGQKMAPTLNITLATHKSTDEPEKADFVAQHNQLASGTELELKELTTKKNADIADVHIRDLDPPPEIKAKEMAEAKTRLLSSTSEQARKTHDLLVDDHTETEEQNEGEIIDAPIVNPEIASLRAKLDRQQQEMARQPRIRRLTSVSAKASYDAAYLNMWTQKIEGVGNKHFPETAVKNGIYGNLRMAVLLRASGDVEQVEILQSSGHQLLDDAAIHIVKLSSPFPQFPREIARNTDKLEIIRTWRFEITGLSTSN